MGIFALFRNIRERRILNREGFLVYCFCHPEIRSDIAYPTGYGRLHVHECTACRRQSVFDLKEYAMPVLLAREP